MTDVSHQPTTKYSLPYPVFVTGVWKSGNHLVYSALNELGVEGPFNGFAAHLLFGRGKAGKQLLRGVFPGMNGIDVGLETEARIRSGYLRRTLRRLSGMIVGGHAAYSEALAELLRNEGARVITIRRDPRDILVSFADWIGSRPDFYLYQDFQHLDREDRIRLLLNGSTDGIRPFKPFVEVLQRAEGWLTTSGALQLTFEDLVGDAGGGSAERQTSAVASIHSHVGAHKPLENVDFKSIYGNSLTFNQGRAARWRELESPDLIAEIEKRLGPKLHKWGY